ncbi:unnamed protein product [Hymenolepis diminuta]|uniref:Kinesin-like protein n=1 Tax=Hymenolepis diminuta TaxID=6216 RepID=A0A0R3SI70_HYMDI|nr:unnamed protein product [Hymenolepis diminuta]
MAESIKVVCRVRPLNENEKAKDNNYCVNFPPDSSNLIKLERDKTYAFDHVFQPKTQQVDVYNTVAKPIVADVLNGYNGTIFAYGQTASGKTFTMEGVLGDQTLQGIIPRIVHDIFNHIYNMEEYLEFHIKVSYFEIYLDKIRDLLDVTKNNLSVHEDKNRVPYVKGATERFVSTPEDVFDVIDEGKANRHVSVTNMNEHSSRSHSIFMFTVTQENLETKKKLHGKLYLVDLAGSEKVAKTGAEGSTLTEAMNINKSLSALGNVINALVDNHAHVPYRDSKLTRILQESLGGNAKTTMIICCSPSSYNEAETKSTLLFGMRAKTIKNIVTVNEELTAEEWRLRYERLQAKARRMKEIIDRLEAELKRWRAGENVDTKEWVVAAELEIEEPTDEAAGDVSKGTPALPSTTTAAPGALSARPVIDLAAAASVGVSEEQLHALYQQLDDKDEEITKHTQTIERLRQQLEEQEQLLRAARVEAETSSVDAAQYQAEWQSAKEEAKEILQALEELALSHAQRDTELSNLERELEDTREKLQQTDLTIKDKESEVQLARDSLATQRKKYAEVVGTLIRDVLDVGECMSNQLQKPNVNVSERLDEEVTVMRLYMNKMKTEAKMLHSRVNQLEEERVQHVQLLRKSEDESKEYAIRVRELETKVQSLTDKVDDSDSRKRQLQDMVDNLNADVAKLRANEQLLAGSGSANKEILAGQSEIRVKLDEEFKRQSEQYAQQVKYLRDELESKEKKSEALKDELNHVKLQYEKSSDESSALRKQLEAATERLQALEKEETRREQSKQDLKALEETMVKEFNTLATLRRLFVLDLKNRIKKSTTRMNAAKAAETAAAQQQQQEGAENAEVAGLKELIGGEDEEDESSQWGTLAQREKIAFLENNLAKLTNVHKQLIHDNAELRCELPKLEKRLRSTVERVRSLEISLKEAKEGAMRDRKRYQHEVDRIKEAVRRRQTNRMGNPSATIAKPIRAGHAPQTAVVGAVNPFS